MALKPEPMQRALIVASKGYQPAVIEALHGLRAAHFIDFQEQKDGEFADFRMGKSLPEGEGASARLVRVRALLRHLGLEGAFSEKLVSVRELETNLDGRLDSVEADVSRAVESRESVRATLHEGREMEAKLQPLSTLPVKLEDYTGYDTLEVFVGRADPAFRGELATTAPDHLLVDGDGTLFALFVPKARAQAVTDLLYRHGYAEVEVPAGKGSPAERIREIAAERGTLEARLEKANAELQRLGAEHQAFLLAAEEHLSIQVEKAEAPLAFASTEHAFVADTWIPMSHVNAVEAAIKKATRDNVHFARLETSDDVGHGHGHGHGGGHGHGHGGGHGHGAGHGHAHGDHAEHDHSHPHGGAAADHGHGGVDAGMSAHPAAPAPVMLPPTKYDNKGYSQKYEWFTNLFSTPRYNEIDPTMIFAVVFPVFFGFMVGDLGLGLVMVLLGALMAAKLKRVDGMRQLGTAIMVAGIIAAVLGGLVFKDALGMPLGVNSEIEHHALEGMQKTNAAAVAADVTCGDIYKHAHEAVWTCLFRGTGAHVHHETWSDPILHKVTDVPSMLLISLLAGVVHLTIGLLFGIRNEWGHGGKHLAAKFGYLILLLAFAPAALALLRGDLFAGGPALEKHSLIEGHLPFLQNQAFMVTGVGVLLGAVILGWAEGVGGILEIPSMFGNIMSYLRLGAVAIAKGAMAIAFNSFTIVNALQGDLVAVIVFGLLFLVMQVVLLALGLLSGGIQALRLNFVEFFTKFYKGGGTPYRPFGRERVHTAPATAQGAAVASVMIKP